MDGLIRKMETIEARHLSEAYRTITARIDEHLVDNCTILFVPGVNRLSLNRVVGLGLTRNITSTDIQYLKEFYLRSGIPKFMVQISKHHYDKEIHQKLFDAGFVHHNDWYKLAIDLRRTPFFESTKHRISPLTTDNGSDFGKLITDSFEWEDSVIEQLFCNELGLPGFHHYGIREKGQLASAGVLYIHEEFASLAMAATRNQYRGQGYQPQLIRYRLNMAKLAGCTHAFSETAADIGNTSYKNLTNAGFEHIYTRENWMFEF